MKISKPAGSAFILIISILITGSGVSPLTIESIGSPSGPQAGEPNITITVDQNSNKAYVDPGSYGMVTVSGSVTCEMPSYTPNTVSCIVFLRIEAGGWPVSIPPEFSFSKSISVNNFAISVQVPLGSPVSDSRDVIISGTWEYEPGNQAGTVNSESVYIEIQPYSYLEVLNSDYNLTITGESSKKITASVTNTGNIKAEVRAGAYSSDDGIEVELKETEYSISPYQNAEIEITLTETKNRNGLHTVTLWVEEKELTNQGRITQDFQVQAKEKKFSLKDVPFLMPGLVVLLVIILAVAIYLFMRRRKNLRRNNTEDIEIEV